MSRLHRNLLGDLFEIGQRIDRTLAAPRTGDGGAWVPPVDMFERDDDLVIRVELPGVARDAIDVRLEQGTLVLRGERRPETPPPGRTYRSERAFGRFSRSFAVPPIVDGSRIRAVYRDGVLELVLPRAEASRPRRIEISAA